jgi:uncharacterized protein with NRDE domain
MCLALLALRPHHPIPLLIAANRDEFHARRTEPAQAWQERPDIYAGRDGVAGGTWMGITRSGRYALVTNYREPGKTLLDAPSRGALVSDFLAGHSGPEAFLAALSKQARHYNGFNLIVGDRTGAAYFSNRQGMVIPLAPGIYGVSNHLLDTPWPKLVRSKAAFERVLAAAGQAETPPLAALLDVLRDRRQPADELLPDTGLPPDRERLLSSPFIASPTYGTRACTVAWLNEHDGGGLYEYRFGPDGDPAGVSELCFEGEKHE